MVKTVTNCQVQAWVDENDIKEGNSHGRTKDLFNKLLEIVYSGIPIPKSSRDLGELQKTQMQAVTLILDHGNLLRECKVSTYYLVE